MRMGDNAPSPQLRKKSQIKTIHSSLAIEHNSLSLKQVMDIIDGKRVLGAPDEIQEVKNAISPDARTGCLQGKGSAEGSWTDNERPGETSRTLPSGGCRRI